MIWSPGRWSISRPRLCARSWGLRGGRWQRICKRVCAERRAMLDPFADLREIGFDEISVRSGQRYITVVVDHRSGRLVWAGVGRDRATVERFLDLLGPEGCEKLELVSCDDADWVTVPVAERCPNADICLDAFHVVKAADRGA